MCDICDKNYLFKGNLISRIPKPVELPHECIKTNFKYQDPEFYYRLFDESGNEPFGFSPRRKKTYDNKISTSCFKVYVL